MVRLPGPGSNQTSRLCQLMERRLLPARLLLSHWSRLSFSMELRVSMLMPVTLSLSRMSRLSLSMELKLCLLIPARRLLSPTSRLRLSLSMELRVSVLLSATCAGSATR